jgi:YVTN family beta-propeller protein
VPSHLYRSSASQPARPCRNRQLGAWLVVAAPFLLAGCHQTGFPAVAANYREYAYVADTGSDTVTVLDLVYLRPDRTLQVGQSPIALAASPTRNEVYAVSAPNPKQQADGAAVVIDATTNTIAARIPLHHGPSSIAVAADGQRAYVTNSGSNTVSVIDLEARRELGTVGTGEQPELVRVSPDMRSLLVTNRASGSVSLYDIAADVADDAQPTGAASTSGTSRAATRRAIMPRFRATFDHCPGASDAVILQDNSKAFVTCSGSGQIMALQLASELGSWPARQEPASLKDHLLTFLDVGKSPVHLALKPDSGEVFVSNFGSDSVSEISTFTNEVLDTAMVGDEPAGGVVSSDGSELWTANFGSDTVSLYSIDDGRLLTAIHVGSQPRTLAFSADEHLLLATDTRSGDVSVIRTGGAGPGLFTLLPAGRTPTAIITKAMTLK